LVSIDQKAADGHPPVLPNNTSESSKSLRDLEDSLVNLANDKGGAFDCIKEVVSNLVLYDWQLFSAKRNR